MRRGACCVLLVVLASLSLGNRRVIAQVSDPAELVVPASDLGLNWSVVTSEAIQGEGKYGYAASYQDSRSSSARVARFEVIMVPTARDAEATLPIIWGPGQFVLAGVHSTGAGPYDIGDGSGMRFVLVADQGGTAIVAYLFHVATAVARVEVVGQSGEEKELDSQALEFAQRQQDRLRSAMPSPPTLPNPAPTAGPISPLWTGAPTITARYAFADLGTLPGFRSASARGLSNAGQVIGHASGGLGPAAFLWQAGVLTPLGGGALADARGINGAPRVVGEFNVAGRGTHAFIWDASGMRDLGTLPDGTSSSASGINSAGQVAGKASPDNEALNTHAVLLNTHAVLWNQGVIRDLGTLGGNSSEATGINDAGQVVGRSEVAAGGTHAFIWDTGQMNDLGTLGGENSSALAVNQAGWVVGQSTTGGFSPAGSLTHAWVWDGSVLYDLGTLGGAWSNSSAVAINAAGQIVGWYEDARGTEHAFLWQHGEMLDLTSLVQQEDFLELTEAVGINDAGQIVATGTHNGLQRAVLLTPDPS